MVAVELEPLGEMQVLTGEMGGDGAAHVVTGGVLDMGQRDEVAKARLAAETRLSERR